MGYLVPATLKEADALGIRAASCNIRHRSIVGAVYGVDAPHREGTIVCCGDHLPEIVRLAAMHLPGHGAAVTVRSSEFARWKAAPDA